jgi:hypothetical protein
MNAALEPTAPRDTRRAVLLLAIVLLGACAFSALVTWGVVLPALRALERERAEPVGR